jgi:glycosyltransferase involved in cell wall biosynthesis
MIPERLEVLFVSQWPPSPACIGAQRRVEGLMTGLARRHRVSCISLVDPSSDPAAVRRAMSAYSGDVVLVPTHMGRLTKRALQLRAVASTRSFERHQFDLRALRHAISQVLRGRRYDVVSVETPHFMQYDLRQAPAGAPPPRVLLDEHNIEFDLARQSMHAAGALLRRIHHGVNWRKIRREELAAWRSADGVAFTSDDDAARARAAFPAVRAAVAPNAVDVEHFRPAPELPAPDGRTVLFFGTLDYFPNQDAMRFFLDDIWPSVERRHPGARLEVVGPRPTAEVLARRGPRIQVLGVVDDLRPHLARAACVIAPLRVGGGTRFKILEGMAMGKAVVSTALGAEGIGATHGRDIVIADDAAAFADALVRVLHDPDGARSMGSAARELVVARYSWSAVAERLEAFLRELLGAPAATDGRVAPG